MHAPSGGLITWSVDPVKVFTVGHSTRELDDFMDLLEREGVTHLVDVRAFPASRRYPHFNKDALAAALDAIGIRYTHMPELGGRRTPRRDSHNTAWKNSGFRGYADYMETREFREALDDLISLASADSVAIMCAEAVPWRCHRTLVSDALLARAVEVFHIIDGNVRTHTLTSFGVIRNGSVRYESPAEPDLFAAR